MPKTGIELFTLSEADAELTEIIDRVGETDLDGIELADWIWPLGRGGGDPEEVRAAIERNDLEAVDAYVNWDVLTEDPEAPAEAYRDICDAFVIPYSDGEFFQSAEALEAGAAEIGAVADELAELGYDTLYHNHEVELTAVSGEPALYHLARELPDLEFVVDAAWVAVGGADPAEAVRELGDQVRVVHLKDAYLETGTDVELGTGDVDIEAFVEAALDVGVPWLVYELDDPEDPWASLEHGAARTVELAGR